MQSDDSTQSGWASSPYSVTADGAMKDDSFLGHEAIQQRLAELDAIYNTTSLGLCLWDTDLRYVRINQALAQINGVPIEAHIGRSFEEILPDLAATQAPIVRRVIETGEPVLKLEARGSNPGKPGVIRNWLVSYVPLKDAAGTVIGVSASVEEITKLKQAQARSQESDDRFQSFFNANLIGILFGDVYGNVRSANNEFLRIIGYSREELEAGQIRWTEITPPEYLPLDAERIAQAQEQGACNPYEKEYIRKDGSRVPVMVGYSLYGEGRTESIAFILDITELKQSEQELRINQERLSISQRASKAGTWDWNVRTGEVCWSDEYYQLYGIDRSVPSSYENWLASVLEEDREIADRLCREAIEKRQTDLNFEFRIQHPTLGIRWFASRGQFIYDAQNQPIRGIGISIDVTNLKQTELAMRESEERFRTLADNMAQLAWIADETGSLFWYNKRWLDYTGKTFEEMQGWGWKAVQHPDHLDRVMERWQHHLATGEIWEDTFPLRGKDGKFRWFLSRALPIRDEQGQISRWFGTNTDISDRIELEDALKAQTEELLRANQIKDEFLAVVSHELRTPLNPILGWSKLLQTRTLNETQTATALETIQRNAQRQAQLIDDLLDMSRILRGKLQLECRFVELSDVITSAIETVQLLADAKQIRIEKQIFSSAIVWGDPTRLQQIIWNLLTNAVKFSPENERVEVHLHVVNAQAQVQVIDYGKGIVPEFLPYVFDRFKQEDSSSTRKFGGLGLGLAIVRQLTELQGGTVSAESPGEDLGATFTVQFPLAGSMTSEPVEVPRSQSNQDLENVCALIVEDEPDSLNLLTFILEEAGATVLQASSAAEALEQMEQGSPMVIVSDIGMPEMNGYALLERLREKKNLPAIALTAFASDSDRIAALNAGFQAHLSKPIDPNTVIDTILRVLARAE